MKKKIDSTDAARFNLILVNQSTYLAYVRTGLSIIAFSIATRNSFLLLCGVFIFLKGYYQYYHINSNLKNNEIVFSNIVDLYYISAIVLIGCAYYWIWYSNYRFFKLYKK
jgi:uncharacterized membrane protein YidH (DUF202 family)